VSSQTHLILGSISTNVFCDQDKQCLLPDKELEENMMDTKTIIVGDVGGTNTNLAVAQLRGSEIEILERTTSPSHDVVDFSETLSQFFSKSSVLSNSTLGGICISGAGPVIQNCIKLTNQNWVIDGLTIEKKMKVPTLIINDFSA